MKKTNVRSVVLSVLTGSCALLVGTNALGQASSDIRISVNAQQPSVTYAADGVPASGRNPAQPALVTYSGYRVTVKNWGVSSNNTVNNVVFTAESAVLPSDGRIAAYSPPAVGFTCQAVTATKVSCALGQLKVGDSRDFYIYYLAPKAPTNSATGTLNLGWTLNYAEGANDSTGASRLDTQTGTATVGLGTFNPLNVKSSVPPAKQVQVFTGAYGVATSTDPWTTSVVVPTLNTATTTAEIVESKTDCAFGSTTLCPVFSDITIPSVAVSVSNPLIITLLRDASTIPSNAKIRDAKLFYFPDPVFAPDYNVEIQNCSVTPLGSATTPDPYNGGIIKRCIVSRTDFKNNNAPTPDYVGDWQFILNALENGRLSW